MDPTPSRTVGLGLRLYAGFLSFVCAEVFTGASANWILSPFAILVTYPLYTLHLLFLATVAVRTRRTSLGSLYLLGIAFGLYETWITKVVWAGYPSNAGYAFGGVLGFGIHETLGLVLFYHAVVSFVLPVTLMLLLFPSLRGDLDVGDWLLAPSRGARAARWGLVALLGLLMGFALRSATNLAVTLVPTLAVAVLGYRYLAPRVRRDLGDDAHLPLGDAGLAVVGLLLGLLYVGGYVLLRPSALPPLPVQILTLLAYPLLGGLLWRKRPGPASAPFPPGPQGRAVLRAFLVACALSVLMAAFVAVAPGPAVVLATLLFASMVPVGAVLFVVLGLRARV